MPAWDGEVAGGPHRVQFARVSLTGLNARSRQVVELRQGTEVLATATATTLPRALPGLADRPFSVLLGSCFARGPDAGGQVGRAYSLLPAGSKPDVKVLCGDQVYLDSPASEFIRVTRHSDGELRDIFFGHYRSTWTPDGGMRQVLEAAANWFTPDDHEFWNNAPSRAPLVRDSWTKPGRYTLLGLARGLYQVFQTQLPARFSVPPVSFYLADTRSDRDAGPRRFMSDAALEDHPAAAGAFGRKPGGWLVDALDETASRASHRFYVAGHGVYLSES